MKIREIFYSLQGEGGRAGEPSIFIRLANCNLNCWFCDTDWSWGRIMTNDEILEAIKGYACKWIVWTGGEPTIQLDDSVVNFFKEKGYKQAIETNGTNKVPKGIDYISCSPKEQVPPETLWDNFPQGVNEWRYPLMVGQEASIPNISSIPPAKHYFISPIFLGEKKKRFTLDKRNLRYCIDYIMNNPPWRLSIQQHKLWGVR